MIRKPGIKWLVLVVASAIILALVFQLGCVKTINYMPSDNNLSSGRYGNIAPAAGDSLQVASYNIYLGKDIDLAINDLQKNERLANADILFLQELDPAGCEQIARELNLNYVYWPSFKMTRTKRLFGNAVMSRWPIVGQKATHLPHSAPVVRFERVAVAADIQIGQHRVRAVCAHLSTMTVSLDKRLEQASTMIDSLALVDGPVVFGGDFNTVSKNDRVQMRRLMRKAGFSELRLPKGPTAESSVLSFTGYELMLDHFYFRGLVGGATGIDHTATTSDHYPIWGVFAWPDLTTN